MVKNQAHHTLLAKRPVCKCCDLIGCLPPLGLLGESCLPPLGTPRLKEIDSLLLSKPTGLPIDYATHYVNFPRHAHGRLISQPEKIPGRRLLSILRPGYVSISLGKFVLT